MRIVERSDSTTLSTKLCSPWSYEQNILQKIRTKVADGRIMTDVRVRIAVGITNRNSTTTGNGRLFHVFVRLVALLC